MAHLYYCCSKLRKGQIQPLSRFVVRREDPDAELQQKTRFIPNKGHKARTKDVAEPVIKNLNYEKQTKQDYDL